MAQKDGETRHACGFYFQAVTRVSRRDRKDRQKEGQNSLLSAVQSENIAQIREEFSSQNNVQRSTLNTQLSTAIRLNVERWTLKVERLVAAAPGCAVLCSLRFNVAFGV